MIFILFQSISHTVSSGNTPVDEVRAVLEESEATVWEVKEIPILSIQLAATDLTKVVEKAQKHGVSEFYLADGTAKRDAHPGIGFKYNDIFHAVVLDSQEEEQREELVTELLEEYEEYLSEEEKYQLENTPDHYRIESLIRMKERVQKDAEANTELEEEAAKKIANDNRFNQRFNKTDTKHLLEEYDEFDLDDLRLREVHRQAKAKLKTGR